ncbi:MAG: hypothetical protein WCO83_02370 [Alphaproteobacteria bacterium]
MPTNNPTAAEVQAICAETGNWISPEGAEFVSNICRAYRAEYLGQFYAETLEQRGYMAAYLTALKETGRPDLTAARFDCAAKLADQQAEKCREDFPRMVAEYEAEAAAYRAIRDRFAALVREAA